MSGPVPPPLPSSPQSSPPPLPGDSSETLRTTAKARYLAAARALVARNHAGTEGEGCVAFVAYLVAAICTLTVVLIPVAVRIVRTFRRGKQADAALREAVVFAERAVLVMAFPLMVNSMLRRPGKNVAAGLFLISFEPGKGSSIDFMGELAERVGSGEGPGMSDADRAFCHQLMADEQPQSFRRRKIPTSLTGGAAVYAIDLILAQTLLTGRHISDEMPLVPCMAEPGDNGRTMLTPYWLLTPDGAAPGEAEQGDFEMTLASVYEMTELSHGRGTTKV